MCYTVIIEPESNEGGSTVAANKAPAHQRESLSEVAKERGEEEMWRKEACTTSLLLLICALAGALLTGCDPDYREAGRRTGELYNEVEEQAPTVVAEAEERAPTAAAGAATAARDFSEGLQESGACSGAATVLLCAGVIAAILPRRQT